VSIILSATECTIYSSITATTGTIITKKLLDTIEARIPIITNNYFVSDSIILESTCKFYPSNNSIVLNSSSEHWEDYGFQASDPIFIYNSYRNEGYKSIYSLSDNTAIIASSATVIKEDFNNSDGPIILFSLANWPLDVKMAAYEMAYFDYEVRSSTGIGKVGPGIKSKSLGPWSESYTVDNDNFGYPTSILDKLIPYRLCRLN
jgi:hypothetical protein